MLKFIIIGANLLKNENLLILINDKIDEGYIPWGERYTKEKYEFSKQKQKDVIVEQIHCQPMLHKSVLGIK